MKTYPEHEKLMKVNDKSQELGLFLTHLKNIGLVFVEESHDADCRSLDENGDLTEDWRCNCNRPLIRKHWEEIRVLAEYFGIDYDELQEEKHQMWEEIRNEIR